jgi:antitoxin component of MazEF toxin-antitoxin module
LQLKVKNNNMRRKLGERNIRKLSKRGASYSVTLPLEFIKELKWREKQKIVMKKEGKRIIIEDWKK